MTERDTMTRNEKRTVVAVFGDLLMNFRYDELNTFMGSITIEEMQKLYNKLKYEPYCKRHGIKYKDMTEDDFINAYEEENGDYDYERTDD